MTAHIKPTIGRVVWYYPREAVRSGMPWAALICHVTADESRINLGGFDNDGFPFSDRNVPLLQDPPTPGGAYGTSPSGGYATWMPYQKGQAAKTEALEKSLLEK